MADYEIEVKAQTDITGINQQLWANTPLKDVSSIYARLRMSNPINVGIFPYAGVYVPDDLSLEIEGTEEQARGSQFANGGNWADVTVINHGVGSGFSDGFFLNIEPRALPGLPFGDIGKFSLRLWLDVGTLSSIDPPTDASFMNGFPSPTHPPRVEWHFMNPGGIGSGFSWGVSWIEDAGAAVRHRP